MSRKIGIIGSGFAGLSAACHLAKAGNEVFILEKNETPGGRARQLKLSGFTFDMGPSWYWMPDVFENFFQTFGKQTSDYYQLIRLDPSYRIKFEDGYIDLPASMAEIEDLFETLEAGSALMLRKFLAQAAYKYEVGIKKLVHKPGRSLTEFIDPHLITGLIYMDVFTSMSSHIRKFFKNKQLIQLLEFPALFLGASPEKTPALYSLMNYADLTLGTWYPLGGMYQIAAGMACLAEDLGVTILYEQQVEQVEISGRKVTRLITTTSDYNVDVVVGGADYHHIDQNLLPEKFRNYNEKYWDSRTMAPSSLLFFLGIEKKLPNMEHHVLFFDQDFRQHAREIYEDPKWPVKPLFYTSMSSRTDPLMAPAGGENLVVLIPTASGLEDNQDIRNDYFSRVIERLEDFTETNIRDHIIVNKSFAHNDFIGDYNAFKGNAYGLANTLLQTAIFKPSIKNKKLRNLYFTGQLTVPGPGVPPSIISGKIVAREIIKDLKKI